MKEPGQSGINRSEKAGQEPFKIAIPHRHLTF